MGTRLTSQWWIKYPMFRRTSIAILQLLPPRRWRVFDAVLSADDVPGQIPLHRAILVSTPTLDKWLAFNCPCGTGHRIVLNLDSNRNPYWRLGMSILGKISLSPSIDYKDVRVRCHYMITKGRVIWTSNATTASSFERPR